MKHPIGCVEPVMETDVEAGLWATEPESLLLRLRKRFGRAEPRQGMRDYVRGPLHPVGRKNSRRCIGRRTPGWLNGRLGAAA
ncbi:hypothetical protein ACIRQP_18305 [Streptomyces sp. NPDC102274]|uniref:hypothetical protein n=1 Tax=Streptomyces sp. NPDC102274 TaxID=3366151 RepID=UPI003826FAB9